MIIVKAFTCTLVLSLMITLLPDALVSKIQSSWDKVYQKLKKYRENSSVKKARKLSLILSKISANIELGRPLSTLDLPCYKFYHELVESLIFYFRTIGISPKTSFERLQKAITKDLKFESKVQKEWKEAFFQFFSLAILVFSFALILQKELEISLNALDLGILFILQTSGVFLYLTIFKLMKKYLFSDFATIIHSLNLFLVLSEVDLPIKKVLEKSQVEKILTHRSLSKELQEIISRWKIQGVAPCKDLEILLDLVWIELDGKYLIFEKIIEVLKFLILAIFFLGSYFFLIFKIFDSLF